MQLSWQRVPCYQAVNSAELTEEFEFEFDILSAIYVRLHFSHYSLLLLLPLALGLRSLTIWLLGIIEAVSQVAIPLASTS